MADAAKERRMRMANVSDAIGVVTVSAKSEADVRFIAEKMFDTASKWHYPTFVDTENIALSVNDNDTVSMTCGFSGYGRWAYENNIDCMGQWLKHEYHQLDLDDVAALEKMPFELGFDYVDYEPLSQSLVERTETLTHKAGMALEVMFRDVQREKEYEFTMENLVKIAGLDEYQAFMACGREKPRKKPKEKGQGR